MFEYCNHKFLLNNLDFDTACNEYENAKNVFILLFFSFFFKKKFQKISF
jgi:hypothetical protein